LWYFGLLLYIKEAYGIIHRAHYLYVQSAITTVNSELVGNIPESGSSFCNLRSLLHKYNMFCFKIDN